MFEHTLEVYERYRSRLAQVERRLARCAAVVVDTGYIEGLQTERTRAVRRLQALEDAVADDFRAARPPTTTEDVSASGSTEDAARASPVSPGALSARLISWLRLRVR